MAAGDSQPARAEREAAPPGGGLLLAWAGCWGWQPPSPRPSPSMERVAERRARRSVDDRQGFPPSGARAPAAGQGRGCRSGLSRPKVAVTLSRSCVCSNDNLVFSKKLFELRRGCRRNSAAFGGGPTWGMRARNFGVAAERRGEGRGYPRETAREAAGGPGGRPGFFIRQPFQLVAYVPLAPPREFSDGGSNASHSSCGRYPCTHASLATDSSDGPSTHWRRRDTAAATSSCGRP